MIANCFMLPYSQKPEEATARRARSALLHGFEGGGFLCGRLRIECGPLALRGGVRERPFRGLTLILQQVATLPHGAQRSREARLDLCQDVPGVAIGALANPAALLFGLAQ